MSFETESDVAVDDVVESEAVESESLELTPRELAIARDEDPDAIGVDELAGDASLVDQLAGELEGGTEPATEVVEPKAEAVAGPSHSEEMTGKAKGLGLSEDDIKSFGSESALRMHVSLLERIEGLTAAKKAPVEEPIADAVVDSDELIDPAKYETEGWDEISSAIPKALRREQEIRQGLQLQVKSLLDAEQARVSRQVEDNFHNSVDSLADDVFGRNRDEYGRLAKLTDVQISNRDKLYREVDTIAAALQEKAARDGNKTALTWDEVVQKARVLAFGTTAAVKPKADKAEALKKQSASRRPVATGASTQRQAPDGNSAESIANRDDVKSLWDKFQRENGSS